MCTGDGTLANSLTDPDTVPGCSPLKPDCCCQFAGLCLSLFLIVHLKNTDPGAYRVLKMDHSPLKWVELPAWMSYTASLKVKISNLLVSKWSSLHFPRIFCSQKVISGNSILYQRMPHLSLSRLAPVAFGGWPGQGRAGFLENLWLVAANPPVP